MATGSLVRVLGLCLLLPTLAGAQAAPPTPPSRDAILAASRDVIAKARYCTFITVGADGHPQARIVDPLGPDDGFTIWLATNPLTRKADQVKRDPRVTLSCFEPATSSYVTVLARAAIVTDPAERARHWKPEWTPFYPNGATGKDVVLIRLSPIRLEIVSADRGMAGDPKTWLPLTVTFP
jgi:general stress protein 26